MNCMRCAREIASGQVFCEECRAIMEKYPVNPDTPVHLPRHRDAAPVRKSAKKRTVSLEEQVRILRKRLRISVIWSLVATALVLAMLYPTVHYLMTDHFKPGQNYSSMVPVETTASTPG